MIDIANKNIIVCDKCSAKFLIESVAIEKCSVEINGEKLLLEYFTCPECNEIYKILLVEEQKYRELLDDLLSIQKRMQMWKGLHNEQMFSRLQKMAFKKNDRMQNYIKAMDAKYSGTFTFKALENNQKEIIYLP